MATDPAGSSYRDPAGFVFVHNGTVYRQVNQAGKDDFELMHSSGLYDALVAEQLMVAHRTVSLKNLPADASRHVVIEPDAIPFISYPYEWSFPQLKDAALLTIRIQKLALQHGMILKDASAYNVQFIGKRPVFIDTLSFARYQEGDAWEGYKQFCEHFITPLALAHYAGEQTLTMLQTYTEGIPLGMALQLLPGKARVKKGLFAHVFIHAKAQARHQGSGTQVAAKPARKVSAFAMNGLLGSLEACVRALEPPKNKTEWGDYYEFTNYQAKAFKDKAKLVEDFLDRVKPVPHMVWDIGANNGEFSELAARRGIYTIAWDIDPKAVATNYRNSKTAPDTMLPLQQDIAAPSPALGWELKERFSLVQRGPADVVLALALIHHLAIGRNVPLPKIASMLHGIGKHIIIEFVPKSDSKVQHLLASRRDVFPGYDQEHFEAAMAAHFKLVTKQQIRGSERTLYLYTGK